MKGMVKLKWLHTRLINIILKHFFTDVKCFVQGTNLITRDKLVL